MYQINPNISQLEAIVLGQMLTNTDCVLKGKEVLTENSFFNPTAKHCFQAIKEITDVDIITVPLQMKKIGYDLNQAAYFIAELTNQVASTAHFPTHCLCLIEDEIKWKIQRETGAIASGDDDVFEMMDRNSEILGDIMTRINELKRTDLKDVWDREADDLIYRTRFVDLDNICQINEGNLIVIAGRPGMGKTWFMLNLAIQRKSTIFSLEMTVKEIANRLKIMHVEKDIDVKVIDNINKIDYIVNEMRKRVRDGCRIFFIDYLQLIGSNGNNREQEVAHASRTLKGFAKETKSAVFLLSQLNREVEKRGNKKPMLSDLRESGAIEQDADIVWMLYRPEYYKEDMFMLNGNERGDVEGAQVVICSKNRHGERTGEILLKGKAKLHDAQIGF